MLNSKLSGKSYTILLGIMINAHIRDKLEYAIIFQYSYQNVIKGESQ